MHSGATICMLQKFSEFHKVVRLQALVLVLCVDDHVGKLTQHTGVMYTSDHTIVLHTQHC